MALQEEFEKQGNWLFKYRSYFPIIVLVIGMVLYVRAELHPEVFFLKNTASEIYYEMLCLAVGLAGLFVRVYTIGYTPRNTSGRNTTEGQVADELNTTGIYSLVRHPLYVGNFLMWIGPAMLTGNLWFVISIILLFWVYYERIMFAEEQFLRKKFGEKYLDWSNNVPAFVPRFRNFKKPTLSFSWKKVIKKEKNGILALFLVFFVFDLTGELIKNETNYNPFLLYTTAFFILFYIVVKILKTRTELLNEADR